MVVTESWKEAERRDCVMISAAARKAAAVAARWPLPLPPLRRLQGLDLRLGTQQLRA
jgi:hypothetical protein